MNTILIILLSIIIYSLGSILYYNLAKRNLQKRYGGRFYRLDRQIVFYISLLSWLTFVIIFIERIVTNTIKIYRKYVKKNSDRKNNNR